jgi:hypothetical protein
VTTIYTADELQNAVSDMPDALRSACHLAAVYRYAWLARRDLASLSNQKNVAALERAMDLITETERLLGIRWHGHEVPAMPPQPIKETSASDAADQPIPE